AGKANLRGAARNFAQRKCCNSFSPGAKRVPMLSAPNPSTPLMKTRSIIRWLAVALAFTSTTLFAQDTLKIGAPQPMTGPDAPFGDKFKKAYSMAVEEINAKGGVNGKKLELIIEDHQAKNPLAATTAEKLITQNQVLVLTGGRASGQAMEIA